MRKWFIVIGVLFLVWWWVLHRTRKKQNYPTISLTQALPLMKTGDLILFSPRLTKWKNPLHAMKVGVSYAYRSLDACEFAHVGVVYKGSGRPLLLHCELSYKSVDVFANEKVTGVTAIDLEERIGSYIGYIVWRPIAKSIDNQDALTFLQKTYHLGYKIPPTICTRMIDRLLGAHRMHMNRKGLKINGSFCTEWVGKFFEYCDIFDASRSVYGGYYLPSDFTAKQCVQYLKDPDMFPVEGFELT